ncbi:MAG: GTP-binding protein [Jaaginema sp. PMC 1080.18]|nr:GTP-binding protein [Jaaginema sp. PMC 1080.18]MEC4869044.1 GTP-binding protein [Jaaginema sp. PMC 1078.18]
MRFARLVTLIVGISFILGLMLWLIDSLYRLYIQVSFTTPFLANILLLLLIVLLGLLIAAFIYYFNLFSLRKSPRNARKQRRITTRLPEQKAEAAQVNLQAVRQQVTQIQDRVSQEALLARSRIIESTLNRGELRVVIFGTGSAGKTSVVNSILGEMVGEVNPSMGTTQVGETYSLQLPGLNRQILITDTPGILEAGVAGTQREEMARELATSADLLLFVVDNDLRQSEYEPLLRLAEMGKRSLLVLNKCDLYTERDREIILARLREVVRNFIATADIIAISANPQPATLNTGEIVQPEPDILPLIKRLAAVLRAEGEDLVADNILLQSQRLGDEARRLIDKQRRRQADKIIDRYQWIGAGVIAVTPVPVVDILATAAVNAQMVVELGKIYGIDLDMESGRELALSLGRTLVSLGIVKGAIQLLATALQFAVATYLIGKAVQGVTAAYLTRIAGKSFVEYFRQDQDWGDGGMTEVVQRQFRLVQKEEFMTAFVKDAIARVVEPLKESLTEAEELESEEPQILQGEFAPFPPEADDWNAPPRRHDTW